MTFNNILNNTSLNELERDHLTQQAIKRREYNRQYQAKVRKRAMLLTLEKKIEENLEFVINYIKREHSDQYSKHIVVEREQPAQPTIPVGFTNWLMTAGSYKTAKEAYEFSGLKLPFKLFSKLFEKHFTLVDGKYIQN